MNRARLSALFACVILTQSVSAGEVPRFHWKQGDILDYRVRHGTTVTEVVPNPEEDEVVKTQISNKLDLIKRWEVVDVDKEGVATLRMSVISLRMETSASGREPTLFDSNDSEHSDPALSKEMTKYLNKPLTVIRINPRGELIEVKKSDFGSANRLKADLPFKLILPAEWTGKDQAWQRDYTITLDPPQGVGDEYEATQTYTHKEQQGALVVVGMTSALKNPPITVGEQIPLLPMLHEGDVYFDTVNGRYHAARLKIEKELRNHQGAGSSYRYQSTYVEDFVPPK